MSGRDDTDRYLHKLEKKICGKLKKGRQEKESLNRLLACLREERKNTTPHSTTRKENSVNDFLVKKEPTQNIHHADTDDCEVVAEVTTVVVEPKETNEKINLINKHIAGNEEVEKLNKSQASKAKKKLQNLKVHEKMGLRYQDADEYDKKRDDIDDSRHKSDAERFTSSSERRKIFESFCKQGRRKETQSPGSEDPEYERNHLRSYNYNSRYDNEESRTYTNRHSMRNPSSSRSTSDQYYPYHDRDRPTARYGCDNVGDYITSLSSRYSDSHGQRCNRGMAADFIEQVPDEEEGELIDDDFDDILTGCRRASWSDW